jgi:uncharacterized protein (DUF433 family)
MSLQVITEPVPLAADADGVIRVGKTRVTLDTVVAGYREGMTPEGIVEQYPSLRPADVYSVIGYILNHRDEVEAYLRERESVSAAVRRENEMRFVPSGVQERLIGRRHEG